VHGAIDVKKINLPTSQTAYSRIWWIRIHGDLGIDGLSDFDRIDLIEVDGDLHDALWSIGDITNSATIGGSLDGTIRGNSICAVTVNGAGEHTGNIIRAGTPIQTHNITIQGTYAGDISIAGSMSGNAFIAEDLLARGSIKLTRTSVARRSRGRLCWSASQYLHGGI
jgi:hypothetical protein